MASVADIGELSKKANLPDGYQEWRNDVNAYVEQKRNVQVKGDPYVKVTHQFIKEQDTIYNPITQVYKRPEIEKHVQQKEQQSMIDTLAKNKDRALRYE